MIVRSERPDEYRAVEELHALAFGGPREAQVVAGVRRTPHSLPELSLVAEAGGHLAGHVLFSRVGLADAAGTVRPVVILAPLAVHPDFQGQGVGCRLVMAGLERLDAAGEPLVVVRGHPDYYRRFGFGNAAEWGVRPPAGLPPGEYSLKPLTAYREDYRGVLRYPAAFQAVGYPVEFD